LETTGLGGGATALGVTVLGVTVLGVTVLGVTVLGATLAAAVAAGRAALAFGFGADGCVTGLGVETGLVAAITGGLAAGLVTG
jgi:hypothetical protein